MSGYAQLALVFGTPEQVTGCVSARQLFILFLQLRSGYLDLMLKLRNRRLIPRLRESKSERLAGSLRHSKNFDLSLCCNCQSNAKAAMPHAYAK
jgi:hypothetical protein